MKPWSQGWLIAAGAYPGFCSMKRLLPLDGMLVHRRSLPRNFASFPQQFAGTHLYTWVKRGTVRIKCLAQEHNTMSPARTRTRTDRSGVERTSHEATAPPTREGHNGPVIKAYEWDTFYVVKVYKRDTISAKMVYKRVRGWTPGRAASPYKALWSTPGLLSRK